MQENHGLIKNKIDKMTEKDIKKSLSLKSHKSSANKQSKSPANSKNVTIQVKRKKIITNTKKFFKTNV